MRFIALAATLIASLCVTVTVSAQCATTAAPGLETFDTARYAADVFESLEGMLVRVEDPVVVGPTSRYGEVAVLADSGQSAELRTERGGIRMLEDNLNPIGRMYYAFSTMVCTPASISQEVGRALGAQAGPARLAAVIREGGFAHSRTATQTPFNLIIEATN